MNREIRFSIVSICFNNLFGLQRTIESIDRQTENRWEHIVVDGGSTDGTTEWLKQNPEPRRRWTSDTDNGIYDAMNRGLSEARGELILVLNSGDCLSEDRTLAHIDRSQLDHSWTWAYGAVRLTDPDGNPIGAYSFDPFNRQKFVMGLAWIPHPTVCMTGRLVGQLGRYHENLGTSADQEFLFRALREADPFVITWFLADFERGGVSQSQSPRQRELAWHRMRREAGYLWKGSLFADRAISELMSLRQPARILAKRIASGGA